MECTDATPQTVIARAVGDGDAQTLVPLENSPVAGQHLLVALDLLSIKADRLAVATNSGRGNKTMTEYIWDDLRTAMDADMQEGAPLVPSAGLGKVREACDNLAASAVLRKTHPMASDEMVDKAHKLLSEFLSTNGGE